MIDMLGTFIRYRVWLITLIILVSAGCGFYVLENFRINSDLNALIKPSEDLSWHRDNEYFKKQFPMFEQTALVVVSGEDYAQVRTVSQDLYKRLGAEKRFSEVFAPSVAGFVDQHRVYFLERQQLSLWLSGVEYGYGPMLRLADDASVANLVFLLADHLSANRGLPLPTLLETLISSFEDEQLAASAYPPLVNPDIAVHYEIIVVRGKQNLDQELPNAELVALLERYINQQSQSAGVDVRLTGEVLLAHEEILAALNGIEIAGLISMVLLAIILGVGIRSVGFVLSIFVLLTVGLVMTLALAVTVVGSFNTLSLIFVIMFFGLGVDFAVHFGLRIREASMISDYTQAFAHATKDVGPALMLCMATSSIAFLSFVPTAYVGLGELGLISAMGMLVAFVLTLLFLPLMLSFVSTGSQFDTTRGEQTNLSWLAPKARWSKKETDRVVVSFFVVLVLVSTWFAKELEFDYSVLAMRDASTEGMQTLLALQDAGVTTDYSVSVLAKDRQQAQSLSKRLGQLPLVANVLGPDQLLPREMDLKKELLRAELNRFAYIHEVHSSDDHSKTLLVSALDYLQNSTEFATKEDRITISKLVARLSSLTSQEIETLNQQLPLVVATSLDELRSMLAAQAFNRDQIPEALNRRFITADGEYLLRVQPTNDISNRDAMSQFIEQVEEAAPMVAGRSVVEWGIGSVVVSAFVQATLTALTCIFVVLVLFFRNLVMPMLVLVPIAVSLVFTFAICQIFGLSLNMANILVVPLIIGLGVDTGIHVVHRAMSVGASKMFHTSTARAVVISALTTIGTFFSLSFSPHLGAASIGLLLTVAISLLVMVTFGLLPALIRLLNLDREQVSEGL